MTETPKRFLIIDDDPLNNFITKTVLIKLFGEIHINNFTIPEDGLDYITSKPEWNPSYGKTIIFLDINMPTLSGWEFLEIFEHFEATVKEQYIIYVLSSSVNHSDIQCAKAHHLVIGYIEKPLNRIKLDKIFG
ncbi:MAG: response regulator [Gelidibacter sp.]